MKKYYSEFIAYTIKNKKIIKPYVDIVLVILTGITGAFLGWDLLKNIIPAIFVVWVILNPIQSKQYATLALIFLITTPVFIALKLDTYAELASIYVYYLLILTVVYAINEAKRAKAI